MFEWATADKFTEIASGDPSNPKKPTLVVIGFLLVHQQY